MYLRNMYDDLEKIDFSHFKWTCSQIHLSMKSKPSYNRFGKERKHSQCATDYSASQSKMEACLREETDRIRADDVQKKIPNFSFFTSADEEYEHLGFQICRKK